MSERRSRTQSTGKASSTRFLEGAAALSTSTALTPAPRYGTTSGRLLTILNCPGNCWPPQGIPTASSLTTFIPSGVNSTMEEIAESLAPMFEAVGLRATIDKTAYSARRPTMLDRTIDDVWMFPHGSGITPDGIVQQWLEMGGEGVWNMGAEIPGASAAAQEVLYELDWNVAWQRIAQGLDWFYEWQPTAQAVTWRDPVAASDRISSWTMPTHPFIFPAYLENLQLSR